MRLLINLQSIQILLCTQGEAEGGKREPVPKEKAAEILWGLAVNERNRGDIVEVGGIPALLSLVTKGPETGKTSAIGCLTYLMNCGDEVSVASEARNGSDVMASCNAENAIRPADVPE